MAERKEAQEEARKERVPFGGQRTVLQLSQRDRERMDESGYVARWINDQDGRLEAAIEGGYEYATPDEARSVGGAVSDVGRGNTDLGGRVSKVVSRGSDQIRAFLMKIKKEWYDEDQRGKAEKNMAVDLALRPADQGGQTIESGYTPK